jgi:hypothetical protein
MNTSDQSDSIIFIHGLTGKYDDTWRNPRTGNTWPASLLSQDLRDCRMLAYSYDADIVNAWNPASLNRISDHAKNLLGAIARKRDPTDAVG